MFLSGLPGTGLAEPALCKISMSGGMDLNRSLGGRGGAAVGLPSLFKPVLLEGKVREREAAAPDLEIRGVCNFFCVNDVELRCSPAAPKLLSRRQRERRELSCHQNYCPAFFWSGSPENREMVVVAINFKRTAAANGPGRTH